MARILAYGSSATYGLHGGPEGGWVERLKTTFVEREEGKSRPRGTKVRVFNFAAGGLCMSDITMYLPADIRRYHTTGRMIGAFMVGNAESAFIGEGATKPMMSLEDFIVELKRATEICQECDVRPLFVGMSPVDDERIINPNVKADSELGKAYDAAVADHATDSGASYVDLQGYLDQEGITKQDFLSPDGQHPNAFGHGIIHQLVLQNVDQMLKRKR